MQKNWNNKIASTIREKWTLVVLVLIMLAGFALRMLRVGHLLPYSAVPEMETNIVGTAVRIITTGDLNPHYFNYPSLLIYMQAIVVILYYFYSISKGAISSIEDIYSYPAKGFMIVHPPSIFAWARTLIVIMGTLSILLTYQIATKVYQKRSIGIIAASIVAFSPVHVFFSTFSYVDLPLSFLTLLNITVCLNALDNQHYKHYIAAGVLSGLCLGAKYNGGIVMVSMLVLYWLGKKRPSITLFTLSLLCIPLAFLASTPYALLDLPTFLKQAGYEYRHYAILGDQSGVAENAWHNAKLYLEQLANNHIGIGQIVLFALPGLFLGCVLCNNLRHHAVMLAFSLAYFYFMIIQKANKIHNMISLVPFIAILAAAGLWGIAILIDRLPVKIGARNIIAAALIPLFIIVWSPSLRNAVQNTLHDRYRQDTRSIAASWVNDNLPAGSKIAVAKEIFFYLPSIDSKRFYVTQVGQNEYPISWYREQNIDYIISSDRFSYWFLKVEAPEVEYITDKLLADLQKRARMLSKTFQHLPVVASFGHEPFYIDAPWPDHRVVIYRVE